MLVFPSILESVRLLAQLGQTCSLGPHIRGQGHSAPMEEVGTQGSSDPGRRVLTGTAEPGGSGPREGLSLPPGLSLSPSPGAHLPPQPALPHEALISLTRGP